MSRITTIQGILNTKLATVFPLPHRKLTNPFWIDQNDALTLNRGYGFYLGFGSNTNRYVGCNLTLQRQVIVTNTVVNRGTDRDIQIRESAELLLLEDQFNLIKAIELDSSLSGNTAKFTYTNDNGIESIFLGQNNYLKITTSFVMEYFEDLNA